jgi:hypothetical protein
MLSASCSSVEGWALFSTDISVCCVLASEVPFCGCRISEETFGVIC